MRDNTQVLKTFKVKKIFSLDFICFACISLVFWIVMLYTVGHSINHHSHYDEHTLQALAWKDGRNYLHQNLSYLELAQYKDKVYISFPPTSTLLEFPFTFFFNRQTPNTIVLLITTWFAMLFSFFILLKLTGNRILSYLVSFSFFWGSTILYLSLEGAVWHQGQLFGLFFAVTAFLILLYSKNPFTLVFGGFCLGLAVGCRPFYLIYTPLFIYYGYKRFPDFRTIIFILIGGSFPCIFYGIYNFFRFDSFFEFGHKYLSWSKTLQHGVFSFAYFPNNIFHAFIQPPIWDNLKNILSFHGAGTGLWFSSPIILLGFVFFFKYFFSKEKDITLPEIIFTGGTILVIWFLLLLHESNGWFQFGYRFSVDLIPILLFLFGRTFRKVHGFIIPISQFSIIVNIYGALWFYILRL